MTLVAGSDTSEDSMDSLENQKIPKIPSFVISEPSENQPSITRGIGRKISQESEQKPSQPIPMDSSSIPCGNEEFFLRRNSCYSDDSLSNDSISIGGNQSPSSGSNTQSSHQMYDDDDDDNAKMQISHELQNAGGAEKFQIFQNLTLDSSSGSKLNNNNNSKHVVVRNEPSFEVELSEVCSKLEASDILEMLKRTINDQVGVFSSDRYLLLLCEYVSF